MRLASILLAFCMGLVAILLISNQAWAVSYQIRNISNNNFWDRDPLINANGQIVWAAQIASGGPIQIFYYDSRVSGTPPLQITSRNTNKFFPQINGNGQIVWQDIDGIYYYDARISGEIPHQITSDSSFSPVPQINDKGQIVWSNGVGGISYYDTRVPGETPHRIPTPAGPFPRSRNPQINANGQIVWSGNTDTSGGQIFYYDTRVAGETPHQISNTTINNNIWDYFNVQINANGQVVWDGHERSSGGPNQIFYYDTRVSGETQHKITNNDLGNSGPEINTNGQIIWIGLYQIYYYDTRVAGETPHQITNSGENYYVHINDSGQIVWFGNGPIYYYDTRVAGEIPYQLPITSTFNSEPQINANGQIVFLGNDDEIYLATPSTAVLSVSPTSLSPSCVKGLNAASQNFAVQNTGAGTLNYTITKSAAWLSVTPTTGTSTGEQDTITVNYATRGLAPGKYNATITISAPGATGTPKTIGVTLTVKPPSMASVLLLLLD